MSLYRASQRQSVDISGYVPLSVLAIGEGPPLLLLHGFTGDLSAWGDVPLRLARSHRVVVPDLPGHGASSPSHDPADYEPDRLSRHLALMMEQVAPGPATWVGYSMGGRIALHAVASGAVRPQALILESASPGLATDDERAERQAADGVWIERLESQGITAFVDAWMAQPLFASQQLALPELVVTAERRRRLQADPQALAACLRGCGTGAQPSWWAELATLDLPALLINGALDTKFDGIAEAMASAMPKAVRARVPGAGHSVHLEKPEAWLAAVVSFLDGLSAS